jgi:hypothetical protein
MKMTCRGLALGGVLGLALGLVPAQATIPPEKKQEIDRQIDEELKQSLEKLVSEEAAAARMGFKLPILEPKQPLAAVERLAEKRIEELARQKWPDGWVDAEMLKLTPRYAQWQKGQEVTVESRTGEKFTEKYREVDEFQVYVGPKSFRKEDLTAETLMHVDAFRAKEAEHADRAKLEKQLQANRQTAARELRLDTIRELYLDHGYMMIAGKWTPKYEYFQRVLKEERERLAAHLRGPLEYKHYYNAGFREFKGDWYTPDEAMVHREHERIENELRPEEFMAELDELNHEYLVLVASGGGEDNGGGLFEDDEGTGKKPKATPNGKKKGDDDDEGPGKGKGKNIFE